MRTNQRLTKLENQTFATKGVKIIFEDKGLWSYESKEYKSLKQLEKANKELKDYDTIIIHVVQKVIKKQGKL